MRKQTSFFGGIVLGEILALLIQGR